MKQFWNDRYSAGEYAYGTEPNEFFKQEIQKLKPGRLLMPADGEGRNGVYAATLGWDVTSYDISDAGYSKAMQLASLHSVAIKYEVGRLEDLEFDENSFDAIGLIYTHWPPADRKRINQTLITLLKPGGIVILEGFSQDHLKFNTINVKAGGPKDPDRLLLLDRVKEDFQQLEILSLQQTEVILQEGAYHQGRSNVIRFVGRTTPDDRFSTA